jgi:deoxyhypusine synthase
VCVVIALQPHNAFEPCQIAFRARGWIGFSAYKPILPLTSGLPYAPLRPGQTGIVGGFMMGKVSEFIDDNYCHFNAAALKDAAHAYRNHLDQGGQMLVTLAGAMSTAEVGLSLAEMIREGKVHAISCTGANLEEDIFNLVAHKQYKRFPFKFVEDNYNKCFPNYRELSAEDEEELMVRHLYRVTDTCIPEDAAVLPLEKALLDEWRRAKNKGERHFPHEFLYQILLDGKLRYQGEKKDSWVLAAAQKGLPIWVPGWEDSTLGNTFASYVYKETQEREEQEREKHEREEQELLHTVKTGIEYMVELAKWYEKTCREHSIGFFQIGGGIAGDFPICVVPMLEQNLKIRDVPRWGYFCQISDSTTSYGSYSGAVPNEKISWGKLSAATPKFMIESDAVAPLIFAYVLGK